MDTQIQKDGFLEIPHSADLALKVWAASFSGLFIQAAFGMYSLMRIENHKRNDAYRRFDIRENDIENLLVSFLNELLNDLQQNKKIYDQFRLDINQIALIGDVTGKTISSVGREIKAVTYHDLKISMTGSGVQTKIVFDI
jgi:SHS2 domain-containing protein